MLEELEIMLPKASDSESGDESGDAGSGDEGANSDNNNDGDTAKPTKKKVTKGKKWISLIYRPLADFAFVYCV